MRRLAAALAFAVIPAVLLGQAPPLSGTFQVNTDTFGEQRDPRVASSGNGFVVVWTGYYASNHDFEIKGQRFDQLGQKAGAEFLINGYTSVDHAQPSIAADEAGNFVVAWRSYGQDGSGNGIFGQRFALRTFPPPTQFVKVGPEFPVNTYTTNDQDEPVAAFDGSGNFVVVWDSFGEDGSSFGIFGQRFNNSGVKVGQEFQVNSDTVGFQSQPRVGFDGSGGFVVVWESYGTIRAQLFDKSGAKIQGEFIADVNFPGDKTGPALAVDRAGDFLVVWENGEPGLFAPTHLFGQFFDRSGNPAGISFLVDSGTKGYRVAPSIAKDGAGEFVVAWTSFPLNRSSYSIVGRRFDRTGNAIGTEFPIVTTPSGQLGSASIADAGSGLAVAWFGYGDGSIDGLFGQTQILTPEAIAVDSNSGSGTASDVNGVLEPGETVLVAPAWANFSPGAFADLTASAASFSGPAGGTYTVTGTVADYGTVPSDSLAVCTSCYTVTVGGSRPAAHWDAVFEEHLGTVFAEDLGLGAKLWNLHIGDSFTDVPRSNPFYKKVETLLHNGITTGCNATEYCPDQVVSRGQMAIFVAKGIAGAGEFVPFAGTLGGQPYGCYAGGASRFSDVSPTDSFCRHVHYLAVEKVTLGCSPGRFCPNQSVTRDTMASFIAKAIVAPQGSSGVPVTYSDSGTGRSYSCSAGSPAIHFTDVPVSNTFCSAIHFLWAKGVVDGCTPTTFCPSAPVARDVMAKFIANGFRLQLYRP